MLSNSAMKGLLASGDPEVRQVKHKQCARMSKIANNKRSQSGIRNKDLYRAS